MYYIQEALSSRKKEQSITIKKKFSKYIERQLLSSMASKKFISQLILELIIIGILYLFYCLIFLGGAWHLRTMVIVSIIIFEINYIDFRIEIFNRKIMNDSTKTIRKLKYYLIHTKSISKALQKTYDKAPETTRYYISNLKKAVDSGNVEDSIDILKNNLNEEWLKMICNLVKKCSISGDNDKIISKNLSRTSKIMEFVNIQQGLDNSEILWIQLFIIILPLLGIPGINLFNAKIFEVIGNPSFYTMQVTNEKAIQILLISNITALFIGWIRKNN